MQFSPILYTVNFYLVATLGLKDNDGSKWPAIGKIKRENIKACQRGLSIKAKILKKEQIFP